MQNIGVASWSGANTMTDEESDALYVFSFLLIPHITRTPKTRQARFGEPRGGPPSPLEKANIVRRFADIPLRSKTNFELPRRGGCRHTATGGV